MAGRHRVLGKLAHELLDHDFGIEAHFDGVGPHERPAEDPAREARDIVTLERLERHHRDLRGVGNLAQRQTPALARFAQHRSDIATRMLVPSAAPTSALC